ncbi:uncharacterized protein BJ171DRAFT_501757 [Polychytrium aggregatum]|uniref:uncharacterized protein n=1 Tax=Polychytrium aggregatum TaxID=110093 RepID=UPI0022FE7841|nr:uncharacterized protein BJ171DRAFT_501757 [Polychytrium aggregatum]KAI9205315.1 hypothetical protein BJ171DRAFT_501757 [Polychytrium aggregatum]
MWGGGDQKHPASLWPTSSAHLQMRSDTECTAGRCPKVRHRPKTPCRNNPRSAGSPFIQPAPPRAARACLRSRPAPAWSPFPSSLRLLCPRTFPVPSFASPGRGIFAHRRCRDPRICCPIHSARPPAFCPSALVAVSTKPSPARFPPPVRLYRYPKASNWADIFSRPQTVTALARNRRLSLSGPPLSPSAMSKENDVAYQQYQILYPFLQDFLQSLTAEGSLSTRALAGKDKLVRLANGQLTDLARDVTDELERRRANNPNVPFLPVREEFHQKRNQARQKLATLTFTRYRDLAADVFFEIERRYPHFLQEYRVKHGIPEPIPVAPPRAQSSMSGGQRDDLYTLERNPPKKSMRPESAINFANLDRLMTDLGTMVVSKEGSDTNSLDRSSSNMRPNPGDGRIEFLSRRIRELEAENYQLRSKVIELEEGYNNAVEKQRKAETELSQSQQELSKLKQDQILLQDAYNKQQHLTGDIQSEASNLLEEIKTLSKTNEELGEVNTRNQAVIRQLTEENQRLANLKGVAPLNTYTERAISEDRLKALKDASDNLLIAGRGDSPTGVLVAMKAVVLACKNITEDCERYENSVPLSGEARGHIDNVKMNMSNSLTGLMNTTKSHATNLGRSSVQLLEAALGSLCSNVTELAELLNGSGSTAAAATSEARVASGGYEDTFDVEYGDQDYDTMPSNGRPESYAIEELKIYLEDKTDQIVQAIQTLLITMRQQSQFGQEFRDTVGRITTIVSNLLGVSRSTLSKPGAQYYHQEGMAILGLLEQANYSLDELGNRIMQNPQSKTTKQQLASSSYDIAKYIKELINLIESDH